MGRCTSAERVCSEPTRTPAFAFRPWRTQPSPAHWLVIRGSLLAKRDIVRPRGPQSLRSGRSDNAEIPAILPRVIERKERDIPHGSEIELAVEFTRVDGRKTLVRTFSRKIDLGDSYVVICHSSRNSEAPLTQILSGTKGAVDGNFRSDQLETVTLLADGTVRRAGLQNVKVRLDNPYPGLSFDEALQRMGKDRPAGPCGLTPEHGESN